MLAFASENVPMYIPGFAIIGAGGQTYFTAIFHLSNLFPNREGVVSSVFSGAFNMSAAVFLFLYHIYKSGVGYTVLFATYALVPVAAIGTYILLFPRQLVPPRKDDDPVHLVLGEQVSTTRYGVVGHGGGVWEDDSEDEVGLLARQDEKKEGKGSRKVKLYNKRSRTLSQQVFSIDIVLLSLLVAWATVLMNFYIAEVDNLLAGMADQGSHSADDFITAFTWFLPFGALLCVPISSFIMDVVGLYASLYFISILPAMAIGLCLIDFLYIQLLGFYCLVQGITLLYAAGPAFVSFLVGIKSYGVVWGIILFVTGFAQMFIYMFTYIAQDVQDGSYTLSIAIMLGVQIALIGVPIFFTVKNRMWTANEEVEEEVNYYNGADEVTPLSFKARPMSVRVELDEPSLMIQDY